MPLRTTLFQKLPWIGGVNTALEESQIDSGELIVGDNVQFDTRGSRKKREGIDFNFDNGTKEITEVIPLGGSATPNSSFFNINAASDTTLYYVWYDKDGTGVDPAPAGRTAIEVDILTADTVGEVVQKTTLAIDAVGDFVATEIKEKTVVITRADVGGDLGGDYFHIEDNDGTVRIWYDVDNGSVAPAVPPGGRLLEVDIATGDSANVVATNTKTALDADGVFTTVLTGNRLEIEDSIPGIRIDGTAETSGFVVAELINGTDIVTITNALAGATTDAVDGSAATGFTITVTIQGVNDTFSIIGLHDFFFGFAKPRTHLIVSINNGKEINSFTLAGVRSADLFAGTAWASSITTVSMETIINLIIIAVDGTSNVMKKWDGITGTVLDLGGTPPPASICREHLGRLWCNDKTEPDRLHYSTTGNPEEWNGTGDSAGLDIGPGDGDPDGITAIFPTFQGQLFVAKRTKLYRVSGDTPETFKVDLMSSGIGCISHNSATSVDQGDVIFVSERGVHSLATTDKFGDFEPAFLSASIQKTFNDDWDKGRFPQIWGSYLSQINSIALAVTDTDVGAVFNQAIWLYNIPLKSWYRWRGEDLTAEALIVVNDTDQKRFYLGNSNNRVARSFNSQIFDRDEDGVKTAIPYKIQTGVIFPGDDPYTIKGFKKVGIIYKPVGTHTLDVNFTVDNFDPQPLDFSFTSTTDLLGQDFVLGQSTLGFEVVAAPYIRPVDGYGRGFRLSIEQNGIDEEVEIQGFTVEYEKAGSSQETRND